MTLGGRTKVRYWTPGPGGGCGEGSALCCPPHSPAHSSLQILPLGLEPRGPVGFGVPGDRWGAGEPSQVLVAGVQAPDSYPAAHELAVPTAPALASGPLPLPSYPLGEQAGQALTPSRTPATSAVQRRNLCTYLTRTWGPPECGDWHSKYVIKGNCPFYSLGPRTCCTWGQAS